MPLTQSKLQQSMALVHEAPVVWHIGCVHRCEVVSHLFEQQSPSVAQFRPPAVQLGPPPPSSPVPALMSMPLLFLSFLSQPNEAKRAIARPI